MRRRMLVGVLALLLVGCTIKVSHIGHLILHVKNIPSDVASLHYVAQSRVGLGHYRSGYGTVNRTEMVIDVGEAAEGVWNVVVTAKDPGGHAVYEQHQTAVVQRYETTIVTIRGSGSGAPKR